MVVIGTVLVLGGIAGGCTTTTTRPANTASKQNAITASSEAALTRLYANAPGARELVSKAAGVLVFPSVLAAGAGVGGEYGEGELRIGGKPDSFYKTVSASFGLQLGAQSKTVVFLFMTQAALDKFRASSGWTAGIDASVAVLKVGANGDVDLNTATGDVVGFVTTNGGLMANITIEGTKVSKLAV
jgi:lipid-binding SYLF domain-containing protein